MKRILLLLPIGLLAACADQKVVSNQPVLYPRDAWGNSVAADSAENLRQASHLHTYLINNYVDPNNPRIRHQGHSVDVVEQDEKWNLRPSDTMVANLGPVTAVSDPASTPNPYTAEFEAELAQQRDQNGQMTAMARQMSAQLKTLQETAQKSSATASENEALRQQVDQLQKEVEALKTPPPSSQTLPSSWLDTVKGMFKKAPPQPSTTSQVMPVFRVSVAIEKPETPFPAPGIVLAPGTTIASASLPQEFFRIPFKEEEQLCMTVPTPSPSYGGGDLPPLPQP